MTDTKQYPAGEYYIGDLCYVNALGNHDNRWNRICDLMFSSDGKDNPGSHTIDGIDFWYHGTSYGDGEYDSNIGRSFPVDAGIIGICSAEVAQSEGFDGGHIVEIKHPFTPTYEDGTFYIGHVVICTG